MTKISIEDFPLYEEHNPVNTPKSIKACTMENIRPEDLLYIPFKCSNDKFADSINEKEFQKREKRRLKLIEAVKHHKKLAVKKKLKLRTLQSASQKIECLTERSKGFDEIDYDLLEELGKTNYHKEQRIGKEASEAQRRRSEKESSIKFHKNTLSQTEKAEKREEEEKRTERTLRRMFHKKMLLDIEAEEERARNRKYYEEMKQKLIDEKNRKAQEVYDTAIKISDAKRRRIEKKIREFNEKTLKFEKYGKKELMKDKLDSLRSHKERAEEIFDNARRKQVARERCLLFHYEEANKRAEKNLMRSVGNKLRASDGFRDTSESRRLVQERKAKSMKKPKRNTSKKPNYHTERITEIAKKKYNSIDRKMISQNIERLDGVSKLREEIEERNKKIKEFLKKRQEELKQKTVKQSAEDRKKQKELELLNYMAIWNSWDKSKGLDTKPRKYDPKKSINGNNMRETTKLDKLETTSTLRKDVYTPSKTWTKWSTLIGSTVD